MKFYLSLFVFFLLLGCVPQSSGPAANSASIPIPQVNVLLVSYGIHQSAYRAYGASAYVPVTREWLSKTVYPEYTSQLARAGLWKDGRPRYSKNTQCNYFADKLVTVAQERLFNDRFHSFDSTESPAVGTIWYLKSGKAENAHAINVAILTDGIIFFEPQSHVFCEVTLTAAEIRSIWLVRF